MSERSRRDVGRELRCRVGRERGAGTCAAAVAFFWSSSPVASRSGSGRIDASVMEKDSNSTVDMAL